MDKNSNVALHTGNDMPIIGFGTAELLKDSVNAIRHALDIGYRMIDTSGDYGTQPAVGLAIQESGKDPEDLYIVTKIEPNEDSYEATQKNLEELQLPHVDLMLIHKPPDDGVGEDLWRGLIRAKKEGLVKDIGVSNYSIEQIEALIDATNEVPAVNQIHWTPFEYDQKMYDFCMRHDIIIQAYTPLTKGEELDDRDFREIAKHHGKTTAQVLLRWNIEIGTVPLPKAADLKHQEENLDIFDFELSDEEVEFLRDLSTRSIGPIPQL